MDCVIDRRSLLLASASACAASLTAPWTAAFAVQSITLAVETRVIDVNGRAASVFGIRQPDGTPGVSLDSGKRFRVDLVNRTGEGTIIHWHGQRPPYLQDGVADLNVPLIELGATRSYDFAPTPGTHWMHSHHGLQEQALMAAPLIVDTPDEERADAQDVTVLLHDFSFREPAEILAALAGGEVDAHAMHGMHGTDSKDRSGRNTPTGLEGSMSMDLNDVEYDAFLANDRTLRDPQVVLTERRGRVRLRLINGAASSAFWIDLGNLNGMLVAVDGNPVEPVSGTRFPMAIAQRLDLLIDVGTGAFPVFAQVEGTRERTGIVLASPRAAVGKLSELAETEAQPVDLSLETRLRAAHPLADRPVDSILAVALTGGMAPYVWSINDEIWPHVERPVVREGQRVIIEMQNRTMMAHPMHLHGHHFQVVALNGSALAGAVRDTVHVPAMGSVRIAFDADNPGRWPLHCHNLYHRAAGMMTELLYASRLKPT
jgi:FtsP/CotA-like multicopper oxidase with cupredoxin domain